MKTAAMRRAAALLLCLVLCFSLLTGVVTAADEIWTEEPTGWVNWGHVWYETETAGGNTYVLNWGVREETCLFLSGMALSYYPEKSWGIFLAADYAGGTGEEDAASSPLYACLHDFLVSKQTHVTSYAETRDLYRYTDCMANNCGYISSFYSGRKLNGAWDGGKTWNREHTWPKSKSTGSQEADIMMLRPTSVKENSGRGNLAYGESAGFYNPNAEANGQFDLRGDCARICLYCYVRWSENAGNMWGQDGVMESLDVLLDWMEQDPVDTWEMGRNDAVESITGVRNCFVDYPELAWALFGREVPEYYPTPRREGYAWPPAGAPAYLEARPDDTAHGSVEVQGWAVDCTPAAGYYASGYDVYEIGGVTHLDPDPNLTARFRWEHGRLLYFPVTEADYLVEIHFTPDGQEDPCPTGHRLDREHAEVLEAPSCLGTGRGLAKCTVCGIQKEVPLAPLGHDWGEGEVTREPTIDELGEITFTCSRCGDTFSDFLCFRFDDVRDENKYYFVPVYWAVDHTPRITSGTDATHFSPDRECTRAQVVFFLWAAMGKPAPQGTASPFEDVPENAYYYPAVLWAVENGITSGTDATHFSPAKTCTRAQVVTFLWAAAGKPEPENSENPFDDVDPVGWYGKSVLWAVENRITSGTGSGRFSPNKKCTRGQIVTFLFAAYCAGVIDS